MNVGRRIRAWRQATKMSERQLAEAIGVTPPAIYQWERHGAQPTLGNLQKLVGVFGISMERFYGRVPKARAS